MNVELPKKIFQSRPDVILNIDNEYQTFLIMDEIRSKLSAATISYHFLTLLSVFRVLQKQCDLNAK